MTVLIVVIVVLVAVIGAIMAWLLTRSDGSSPAPSASSSQSAAPQPSETTAVPAEPSEPADDGTVTVAAMGDMLAHDSINLNAETADGYDYTPYFSSITDSYADADVVFCNQEGLSAGADFGISGYPTFNAPEQFAIDLNAGAGCNAINLANNHIGDKGQEAIDRTREVWDGIDPLLISGANRSPEEQQEVSYTEVNGITIALVSFAEYSNDGSVSDYGLNLFGNDALFTQLLTEARANADIVMLSMHWGTEDSNEVNDAQRDYSQRAADLGVDVLIGTGPHVLQQTTWLDGADGHRTLVWYSLGNLLSTQLTLPQRVGGIAEFDLVKAEDGAVSVEDPRFTPTFMGYDWTAEQEAANDILARTNPHVYLLADAAAPLEASRLGSSVAEQEQYVATTLGPDVTVETGE